MRTSGLTLLRSAKCQEPARHPARAPSPRQAPRAAPVVRRRRLAPAARRPGSKAAGSSAAARQSAEVRLDGGHGKSERRTAAVAWPTSMVPPCASTRPFTMNSPRPAPPRRLARQNRRKTREAISGAMPGPWSQTDTATPGAPATTTGSTTVVTVPAPCRMAFSIRLARIWSTLSPSSQVSGRSAAASTRNRSSGVARRDPAADDLAHPGRDVDQLAVHLDAPGLDP